jgi:hypothetical protein
MALRILTRSGARKGKVIHYFQFRRMMKTIVLPAGLSSDLDWKVQMKRKTLRDLMGIRLCFSIPDQAAFNSYILAIDQFSKVWKEFASRSKGVVLYRGS